MPANVITRRTFIAFNVNPGPEVLDCLKKLQNALAGNQVRWVDPQRMHITVTFIGDTPPEKMKGITEILEKYVPVFTAPAMKIRGMGVFRDLRDARVIWLGLDPIPVIAELKKQIDRDLDALGFRIEKRTFRPHLTMGRIKRLSERSPLQGMILEYKDRTLMEGSVRDIVLYESRLRPGGPLYIPVQRVEFA